MTKPGETALIAAVAEVEPYVSALRLRFDHRALEGVPAHITVLHPFVPLELINEHHYTTLEQLIGRVPAFDFRLAGQGRWPNNLHLMPVPNEPFVALTQAVWKAFPEFPPYEGRFDEIAPHLSVAQGAPELLNGAEPLLEKAMPPAGVSASCTQLVLISYKSRNWKQVRQFSLGPYRALAA